MHPTIVCIKETWLSTKSSFNIYNVAGYSTYFNVRTNVSHGGSMILISIMLQSRQISFSETSNDAYNLCAAVVGRKESKLLILSVYRAPSPCIADTKDLCKLLDSILVQHKKIIITSDFNEPKLYSTDHTFTLGCENIITQLALEHNLTQLARVPTRGDSLLDLIFISGNIKAVYL